MSESTYLPVPVAEAVRIADKFHKDLAVILTWDLDTQKLHVTTWGRVEALRDAACKLGEIAAQAAGADVSKSTWYEDFRSAQLVEYRTKIDWLTAALERIRDIKQEVPFCGAAAASEAMRIAKEALEANR